MLPQITIFGQKYSSYNLAIMVGIIFAILAFYKWEKKIPATEKDTIISIVGVDLVVGFFSAFLGNKLLHFQTWEAFREHFFEFTGMTFLCGLIGSILFFVAVYYIVYRDWKKLYRTLNSITPYFILAQIWGRIGCFLGGCCFGKPTDGIFGVRYPENSYAFLKYGDAKLYPAPVLEIVWLLFMLFCMQFIKICRQEKVICYFCMYLPGRFMIEFFRGDNRGNILWGISPSQRICLGILLIMAILLYQRKRCGRHYI